MLKQENELKRLRKQNDQLKAKLATHKAADNNAKAELPKLRQRVQELEIENNAIKNKKK